MARKLDGSIAAMVAAMRRIRDGAGCEMQQWLELAQRSTNCTTVRTRRERFLHVFSANVRTDKAVKRHPKASAS
jgi:hypothetical protein